MDSKWSNTLKQFVGKMPTNCLRVFDHFESMKIQSPKKSMEQNKKNQARERLKSS